MISRAIDVRPRAERPLPREFRPDSGRCKPAIDSKLPMASSKADIPDPEAERRRCGGCA